MKLEAGKTLASMECIHGSYESTCKHCKESKPFDISEYEFSGDLILSGDTDSSIILDTQCESFISINKQDVEAMAKHFKLI